MYPDYKPRYVWQTLTVSTEAYSAGDVVGGLITIPLDVVRLMPCGFVDDVILLDADSVGASLSLYLFNSAPTTIADQAAFAPVIADLQRMIGDTGITLGTYTTLNSLDRCRVKLSSSDALFGGPDNDGNLYAYLVAGATPTYTTASALRLGLGVWLY
jgi:hypothetical protein